MKINTDIKEKSENNKEKKECIWCFGTGKRCIDIGDDNDVEVTCDDCRGTGVDK